MADLFDMSQFLNDFIEESTEIVEHLDKELLLLESQPNNTELLNSIFRSAHTLKGSAAFLNFGIIKELTHKMENLLDKLRNNEISLNDGIIDVLFESMDYLKKIINQIIEKGNDKYDIDGITKKLVKVLEENINGNINQSDKKIESLEDNFEENEESVIDEESSNLTSDIKESKQTTNRAETEDVQVKAGNSIRVDTKRIDAIMNLVSELVTGRNRLLQIGSQFRSEELNETSSFIGRITTELQSAVMKIRMVPLERVFSKFPRVVRDLSKQLNKEVNFITKGQDTELDKIVSEEIFDPLMHMVRNALDHGIETAAERIKAGKNPVGTVSISARQEENFVYIDISDDGKGIDYKVIEAKAIEKNLISFEEALKLTQYDLINFIFKPGFSTAEKISEVSGRGVGMDVVKTSIEKIGGIVDITTEKGKGSTFRIRLPLTLAIMQVLIIDVNGKKYAIPLNSVIESIRISTDEIETISGGEAIFLRGKPLPIVYLSSVFDISESKREGKKINIVVLGFGEKRTGLVIDDMYGKQEIVIKPLGKYLGKVIGITGTAILGDGSIIMILDAGYIVKDGKSLSRKSLANKSNSVDTLTNTQGMAANRYNILYAEDSKSLQKMVKRSLEHIGHSVTLADDGLMGLRKVDSDKFDLVITDYEMPNMNGFDFVKGLRERRGYKYTPVIVLTSKSIEDTKEKWISLNIFSYLLKPFNEDTIINTINKMKI